MRNIHVKVVEKIKIHFYALFLLDSVGYKHTLRVYNTYCFFHGNNGCTKAPQCYFRPPCLFLGGWDGGLKKFCTEFIWNLGGGLVSDVRSQTGWQRDGHGLHTRRSFFRYWSLKTDTDFVNSLCICLSQYCKTDLINSAWNIFLIRLRSSFLHRVVHTQIQRQVPKVSSTFSNFPH